MSAVDSPATLITAITGGIALLIGYVNSRQGRRDTKTQQEAANRLADREQQWEERGEIIADLRTELDRQQTVTERARAAEQTARDELEEARRAHAEDRRDWQRRERKLQDDFEALRGLVVQQIVDTAEGRPPTSPDDYEEPKT